MRRWFRAKRSREGDACGRAGLWAVNEKVLLESRRWVMPRERFSVLVFALVTALCVQNACALVSDDGVSLTGLQSMDFSIFPDGPKIATVDSEVFHNYPSGSDYEGKYVYTYQITNTSDTPLSFFSVEIPAGGGIDQILPLGFDSNAGAGWVDPSQWGVVGSPAQSVQAMFFNTIDIQQKSAVLYFATDSTYAPGSGQGALVGMSSGHVFATGNLYVPTPEPATMVFLSCGFLSIIASRKRPA